MLIDDATQTNIELERRTFQDRVQKEGLELWKKQKEYEKLKKLKEQREVRTFLHLLCECRFIKFLFPDERNVRQILAMGKR